MLQFATPKIRKFAELLERAETLKAHQPERYFHHESFDDPAMQPFIMAEMPEVEKFDKTRKEVLRLRDKNSAEMRPCYEEPLLTKAQELHLFRKYNYLKYRLVKRSMKVFTHLERRPRPEFIYGVRTLEAINQEIISLRNLLASCNFRLATMVLRKHHYDPDAYLLRLSDCYQHVIRSIDYFDWRLGHKFSTYGTWVLRNNLSKDYQSQMKYQERNTTGLNLDDVVDVSDEESEINFAANRSMAMKLLVGIKDERRLRCVKQWFGIDGDRRTLKEISEIEGVTKERVRQLKESGVADMRRYVEEMGIEFNPLEPV